MKRNRPGGPDSSYMPYIMVGAGIITAVIFILLFLSGDDASESVETMQARMVNLENRIMSLESQLNDQRGRIAPMQESIRMLTERFGRIEAAATEMESIQQKIEHINQRQGNLEKKIAEAKPAESTPRPAAKVSRKSESKTPATAPKSQAREHQVADGDTLYSIARQYNVTVDRIRKMNNLSADAVIRPGQKLIVQQ